jgi:hypothetical protein
MKRGTKTWKLKSMVVIDVLAVIVATGIVTYVSISYPGVWNWFILIGLAFLNYKLIQDMYIYIYRLRDRKNRML